MDRHWMNAWGAGQPCDQSAVSTADVTPRDGAAAKEGPKLT